MRTEVDEARFSAPGLTRLPTEPLAEDPDVIAPWTTTSLGHTTLPKAVLGCHGLSLQAILDLGVRLWITTMNLPVRRLITR